VAALEVTNMPAALAFQDHLQLRSEVEVPVEMVASTPVTDLTRYFLRLHLLAAAVAAAQLED
jgi:hypothetical protein